MVEGRGEPSPLLSQTARQLFHLRAGGHKDRDATLFLDDPPDVPVIQKVGRSLGDDRHGRLECRIEGGRPEHVGAVEVLTVELRIYGSRKPDKPAAGALAEGQNEFEFGGGLVYLVGHQGITTGNEVVLKPAAGDASGNDHHVPRRGFRRGFALAVHHPDG